MLRTSADIEEIILIQSIEGRAQAGHGEFRGRRFVDTTEDDIVRALHREPFAVRRARQSLIAEVVLWSKRAIRGDTGDNLLTPEFRPLLGIGTFALLRVNPEDVLRGLFLGGLRDTLEIRTAAESRYGIKIGGGRLYSVDTAVMRRMGFTGEALAHEAHADRIEEFRRVGLITDTPPTPDTSVQYIHIRHHSGAGASDDAAIVCGGQRWGGDTAVGVFLADAIDTLEKYVPPGQEGDQDADLARQIEQDWPALDVGSDDACEMAALAVGGDGLPDSSLRHLLRVDRMADQCPLEAHLLQAWGRPFAPLSLGHDRFPNGQFYALMEGRVERGKRAPEPHSRTRR